MTNECRTPHGEKQVTSIQSFVIQSFVIRHSEIRQSYCYTLRFLRGRQPLCGKGVTSSIDLIFRPAATSEVIALSRPLPGPFTFTSTSFTPNLRAFSATCWAAHWPANGVLLRLPLNPLVPALAQQSVSPLVSVIVTIVLLKVATMWAIATVTLRRAVFFLTFVFFAPLALLLTLLALATWCSTPNKFYPWSVVSGQLKRTTDYLRSLTPFFPATVFLGPLRVRALVLVR